MIEAKGPGYAKLLRYSYFAEDVLPKRWEKQAERQVAAAGSRNIEWFFAEPEAAKWAKRIFDGRDELKKIHIRVVAPEV